MTTNAFVIHDSSTAAPQAAAILDQVQAAWGFVPNLHRVLAESTAALEAYGTLWGIAEKTNFTAIERNIAYLAIIYENECTYCMPGHTNLSKQAGVEAEYVDAIRGGLPLSDPKLQALRSFAASVTRNRGVVSDTEVAAFKAAGYDNQAMLDLLVLGAAKLISNYSVHFAATPLDAFMKGAEWTPPGKLRAAA
jgi:AhpD family alkylhydroperoxidase